MERAIEKQKDVYMCFVDFEKAFDTIKHTELIEMLKEKGIDGKDLRLIRNLYWNQSAEIKIGNEKSKKVEVQRGVRQGCVLSPDLFSLYSEKIMEEIKDIEGIMIGGENINNLRYADDTVLIATTKENLQKLVDKLNEACNRKGMRININKTEVMVATKKKETVKAEITLERKILKQVNNFKYLGSIITEDGRSNKEIKTRIGIAKSAFENQRKILTSTHMAWDLRIRFLKCFVWSIRNQKIHHEDNKSKAAIKSRT